MGVERVLIIGGGPAGLTAAYQLSQLGIRPIVLEKGARVGGLARTEMYKGYRVDIGGHRFFTKVGEVEALWREVLGSDFLARPRLSRIYYNRQLYAYPLRLGDALSKLGLLESARIVSSYVRSRLFPYRTERTFEEWVSNRFGRRLFEIFFKSYTEKVWGIPCHEIGAQWAAQRIQSLSLPRAVWNAVFGQRDGQVKSLIQEFEYPRLGPGMLWERVAERVESRGGDVHLNADVVRVLHRDQRVTGVVIRRAGHEETLAGDAIISSMPISELVAQLDPPAPDDVRANAARLTYRDFLTVALIVNRAEVFPDNWLYIHAPSVRVARIQNFKNWSPEMAPDPAKTCLGLEYFCTVGDELWQKSDAELIRLGAAELEHIQLVKAEEVEDGVVIRQPQAYPVYTGEYQAYLERIRRFLEAIPNLQTVGRNGLHMYNNQDHSMLTAMLAVRNLLGERHDVWSVNVERSYHEEVQLPRKTDGEADAPARRKALEGMLSTDG
ncbi:MAG TPA: NAD(P)/FAD-dependent oxidoreductase [Anaerolineae bacterium]|nr:NAD(P)/FAD-dependent oxidoreductase [Anaerolineae bacterium]